MIESRLRDSLKRISITSGMPVDDLSYTCAVGARLILLFTALLLLVMPWTEYFWHFDRFLRGGQDFEFGLLSLATIFALVIVLSRCRRQRDAVILAVRRCLLLLSPAQAAQPAPGNPYPLRIAIRPSVISSPSLAFYNLPIQV